MAVLQLLVDLALGGCGFIAAVASAVAAFGAWRATHRATKAAEASAATARTLAQIEAQRRHEEMAPQVEIESPTGGTPGWFVLHNRSPRAYVVDVTANLASGQDTPGGEHLLPARGFYVLDRPQFGLAGPMGTVVGMQVSWGQVWLELRYNVAPGERACPCGETHEPWHWRDLHRKVPTS